MDVKLSSPLSSTSTDKHFDFCDDLSEHGYGSLEDLNSPTATSDGSKMVQGCDVSSSSLPTTATTTTITSSSSFASPPLSSSSSIDSIASLNNSSSSSSKPTESTSSRDNNTPHRKAKPNGDSNSDTNNNPINSSPILNNSMDNSLKESKNICKENSSGESRNDQKINDGKVQLASPQMFQSGNRFRFVPKNRQNNDTKCRNGTFQSNSRNNPRGPRKGTRSESDYVENKKRSQMRNRNNEDIVFIIRRVDRSLRRTVSESSGETLPVRGILKYPRGWDRRTQSESNCDNSEQSNLMDSHENGQTQSLECISPLAASCEATTESACSPADEQSHGYESEEKPKKSVHFNCYVSKATFNINSTILNNKHSGSNKKKNRRQNNNNHSSSDHKSTTTTNSKPNKNQKSSKNNTRCKSSQYQQNRLESNDAQTTTESTPSQPLTDQSVNCDATKTEMLITDSVIVSNGTNVTGDGENQSENIDPMELKLRSRQDSGYDSETSDRKRFVEDSNTTTCVKSPNRQFTVKKVDLN